MLISDHLQYTRRLALEKEKNLKINLHKEKKLILILDLDNTLLHSTTAMQFYHNNLYCGRINKFQDIFQIPLNMNGNGPWTHTKLRPFLKQFIEMVQDYFTIYLYTMGNRKYAVEIMRFLMKEVPSLNLTENRIISRDDGHDHTEGLIYKTLRQLSPSDHSFYLILDDRYDVWPESANNLVKAYPYVYFKETRDNYYLQKYPSYFQYFTENDTDPFLLFYGAYLKSVHKEYYDLLEKGEETDVRSINPRLFQNLRAELNETYKKIKPQGSFTLYSF